MGRGLLDPQSAGDSSRWICVLSSRKLRDGCHAWRQLLLKLAYGPIGHPVANADRIKRVAERIVATRKSGHDVVVVVSAMGDTTDELLDLAQQVSPSPQARELDMLLTSGERISNALVAMAIDALGAEATTIIEVRTDRQENLALHRRVAAAVGEALAGAGTPTEP